MGCFGLWPCYGSPLRTHIESRLFAVPYPRVSYPEDLQPELILPLSENIFSAKGIPSIGVLHASPAYTIVYCHGNNENLSTLVEYMRTLSDRLKADVYAVEYKGYWESSGLPSEEACHESVTTFVKIVELNARAPLVVLGYSMGGAPAARAARECGVRALVLMAPFVSAASVVLARTRAMLRLVPLWASFDVFYTLDDVKELACPLLVVHGEKDTVIPAAHGCALSRAAMAVDYVELPGVVHANIQHAGLETVAQWLQKNV